MFKQPIEKRGNNTKFSTLMQILSSPRLNGSDALRTTRRNLSEWLNEHEIEHRIHQFRLFPFFMEIGGLWLVAMLLLLTTSIWMRWGWASFLIAIIALAVIVVEMRGTPLLSRIASDLGENIVIEFEPQAPVQKEIVLSAHYDSKTELLNDKQRAFFMSKLPISMTIMILVGLLGLFDNLIQESSEWWADSPYVLALMLSGLMLALLLPIGINAIFGRFAPPSQGAVDNGAGCAILLGLAEQLATHDIALQKSKVTIVLFCGEEIVVQGSRAYARDRDFSYPTTAINLDLMGQNGDYVVWEQIGSSLQAFPADADLNTLVKQIIADEIKAEVHVHSGPIGTDSLPFLAKGLSATTIGSLDKQVGFDGLHSPQDNLKRIAFEKLPEGAAFLHTLLHKLDSAKL